MIEEYVKIHDKFSLEFKIGFNADTKDRDINDFSFNMWIFTPNSLDINSYTYSKSDFYRDMKSNIRLITPMYLLRDIADEGGLPFRLLKESFQNLSTNPARSTIYEYESRIKMFHSILKSSIREEINHIVNSKSEEDKHFLLSSYVKNCCRITTVYRSLRQLIHVPTVDKNVFEYYLFGDEFMSNVIELHAFKLLRKINFQPEVLRENEKDLTDLIKFEINYKKEKGYVLIAKNDKNHNRNTVSRFSALKKYIESQLFLNVKRKEDGTIVRQFYYSLAAGISMIFATVVAFSFQQKYGNFTTPLFIALVVGYMLKDRIKELSRFYFSYKLDSKYFDTKTDISFNETNLGWYKESSIFVKDSQVPPEVIRLRNRTPILQAENRINDEKIIYYRTHMQLFRKEIKKLNIYPMRGVNNIIRFNILQFTQKMDNPKVPLYVMNENSGFKIIEGEKIYYLNFILRLQSGDQLELKRYRIFFNREGIKGLERF
jgi:hypothetical protein